MYSLHNFRNYAFSQNERVRYPLPLRPWVKGSEGIKELLVNPPLPLREGVRGEGKTAKALRKRSTDLDMLVWEYLRAKHMEGLKFRRQQPIGRYIVDFLCFEGQIIIEADGGQHSVETGEDTERDE
jgi:hypothetical protein